MKKLLLITSALVALGGTPAHADPTGGIATVVALTGSGVGFGAALAATYGAFGAAVIQLGIGLGANALATAIAKETASGSATSVSFDLEFGDDTALAFIVGDYVTAGKRRYIGSWGKNDRYVTDVVEVSALPHPGLAGMWVDDEVADIDTSATDTDGTGYDLGYPVTNYDDEGDDGTGHRIWVRWMDGTQTAADPMLVALFGEDEDYPWTSDMVGTGKSYAIVTTRYDDDTLTTYPTYLFQPEPLPMYDPRLDATAGGAGAHRWGDRATYEVSRNPLVIGYNIARGIYLGDEWVFGGRNLPAWRLPLAEWVAAMNGCDATVELDDGSTEPAYRCGAEITVDTAPADVLEELGLAANARFAEVGGMLKPVVDLPVSSVFSITDGDIVITQGQSFKPFNTVSETYNALSATYPEPAEKWSSKDAPEYVDEDAFAADGERYLPVSVSYAAVPYADQVQRLMRAQMRSYRRMRVHQFYLPPGAYMLEPGVDMLTWTSARNGYDAKQFVVESVTKLAGMNVLVTLREVDPSDYDWSTDFELPYTTATPVNAIPFTQGISDWTAAAITVTDGAGSARLPAILVGCAAGEVGIDRVRVQVRKVGDSAATLDVIRAYDSPYSWTITGVAQATDYQVRGRLVSKLTARAVWSDWITVTTPEIKVTQDDLAAEIEATFTEIAKANGVTPVSSLPSSGVQDDQIVLNLGDHTLYRWDAEAGVWSTDLYAGVPDGYLDATKFAAGIEAVTIVDTLPTVKVSSLVFYAGETYRWNGTAYVKSIPAADVLGQLTNDQIAEVAAAKIAGQITGGQIGTGAVLASKLADAAVTVSKIADGAISTAKFAAGIEPVTVSTASTLPSVKTTSTIVWGGDLYRWSGTAYVKTVAAGDIAGTLAAAQIESVAASQITGQMTNAQIAAVAAAKVTGQITTTQITDSAISTAKLAAGAITAAKLAADAVTADAIAANAVTAVAILSGAVTTAKLAAGAVTAATIAADAVTADKIATNAVTADALAANSVTAAAIMAGAVSTDQLAAGAVTAKTLAVTDFSNPFAGSETEANGVWKSSGSGAYWSTGTAYNGRASSMALNGSYGASFTYAGSIPVTPGDEYYLEAYAIISGAWDGTSDSAKIRVADQNGGLIASAIFGADTIAAGDWRRISAAFTVPSGTNALRVTIAHNATAGYAFLSDLVLRRKNGGELIVDGAIAAAQIAANAITAAAILAGAVTTEALAASSVTAVKVASAAITTGKLAAGAVTADAMAANSVTTSALVSGSVTASVLASNSVTTGKVAAGAIGADQIAAQAITAVKLAVANFSNLFAGYDAQDTSPFQPASGYGWGTMSGSNVYNSGVALKLDSTVGSTTKYTVRTMKVAPREQYYLEFYAARDASFDGAGNSKLRIGASNGTVWALTYQASALSHFTSAWTKISGTYTVPSGVTSIDISLGNDGTAGAVYLTALTMRQLNGGELIVDGAVTANKISAGSITSSHLTAGSVLASAIAAGAVTAAKISVSSLSAISADLGSIVVDTAHIGDLAVTTLKVANNAITVMTTGAWTDYAVTQNSGTDWTTTKSLSFTGTAGDKVMVLGYYSITSDTATALTSGVRALLNGVEIPGSALSLTAAVAGSTTTKELVFTGTGTLVTGTNTLTLQWHRSNTSARTDNTFNSISLAAFRAMK
ncbi:hypothetical protein [Paenirhodobacter enshiensis]|uniref:hypothetical protein n=1 Tax=Paenirhodobacter enshiensis TaxID=1105367 RepID=UPI0006923327|nr:hypothetical protein [Paenirhodobacter enshiensis]